MRELRFRAWIDNEELCNDDELALHLDENGNFIPFMTDLNCWYMDDGRLLGSFLDEFDNIMQYTGLRDKTDLEIYEGDIISLYWLAELGIEELDCNAIGVVKFDKEYGRYVVRLLKEYKRAVGGLGYYTETEIPLMHLNDRDDDEQPYDYEVIGNIYQDIHLLEG